MHGLCRTFLQTRCCGIGARFFDSSVRKARQTVASTSAVPNPVALSLVRKPAQDHWTIHAATGKLSLHSSGQTPNIVLNILKISKCFTGYQYSPHGVTGANEEKSIFLWKVVAHLSLIRHLRGDGSCCASSLKRTEGKLGQVGLWGS